MRASPFTCTRGRHLVVKVASAYPVPMRFFIVAAMLLASPAFAQPRAAPAPRALGTFQGWTAATHTENGVKVCYAFARSSRSEGVPGRNANTVSLLVTHRPNGRDQVAIRSAYTFGRGAELRLVIGQTDLPAYTSQDSAFLRDGRAAVTAMRGGREALARAPGPGGRGMAQDIFPLAGFTAAYDAITRECPAVAPRR